MIVYHGGIEEIIKIDLSKAKPGKDFGKGFYVTKIREQADKWSEIQGERHNCSGIVSCFKFDENILNSDEYDIKIFDDNTKEWARFVIANRQNVANISIHKYDIVIGPVADDFKYKEFAMYLNEEISEEEFFKRLKFIKDDSHQICFCSQKSLDAIIRVDLKAFRKTEDIGYSVTNYLIENSDLSEIDVQELYYGSETYKKVSDETTGLYNKPWQEIYDMLKKEIGAGKTLIP